MDFVVYALVFRLAIIAAGTLCVFLGFRLFVLGVMPETGTNMTAEAKTVKLTVTNAAPGTSFALFGAVLIGVMLANGNPELQQTSTSESGASRQILLRSGGTPEPPDIEAILDGSTPPEAAISNAGKKLAQGGQTLDQAGNSILEMAAAYYRQERYDEAVALPRLVYQFRGAQLDVLSLLARIEFARSDTTTAKSATDRIRKDFPAAAALADQIDREAR